MSPAMLCFLILLTQVICTNEYVNKQSTGSCWYSVNPMTNEYDGMFNKDQNECLFRQLQGKEAIIKKQELIIRDHEEFKKKEHHESWELFFVLGELTKELISGDHKKLKTKQNSCTCSRESGNLSKTNRNAFKGKDKYINRTQNDTDELKQSNAKDASKAVVTDDKLKKETRRVSKDSLDVDGSRSFSGPDNCQNIKTNENSENTFVSAIKAADNTSLSNSKKELNEDHTSSCTYLSEVRNFITDKLTELDPENSWFDYFVEENYVERE